MNFLRKNSLIKKLVFVLAVSFLLPLFFIFVFLPVSAEETQLREKDYFASSEIYPYLQNVSQTGITIRWKTDFSQIGKVEYGLDSSYGFVEEEKEPKKYHKIQLKNLKPDTIYHYRIKSGSIYTQDSIFRTAPSSKSSFSFIVYGDTRANSSFEPFSKEYKLLVQTMLFNNPQTIIFHLGDFCYTGALDEWKSQFFYPTKDILRTTVLYPVIGNHEYANRDIYKNYYSVFGKGAGSADFYYSFNYGNVHFIVLDTNQKYEVGSSQYNWLLNDLNSPQAVNAKWIIVLMHHPAYSSYRPSLKIQESLVPLFEKKGVDVVFQGHDHFYERHYKDGVYYIVSGGGGAPLKKQGDKTEYRQFYARTFEYVLVNASPKFLSLAVYDINGEVIDNLIINSKPIPFFIYFLSGLAIFSLVLIILFLARRRKRFQKN